ncbi:hypothetical protein CDEST_09844 [Colletotrichum destructivum]|uniref:Ecp2 effector protein domain-containing protein n=1 Tax=Colletotrichum destructivum TaxID=34406 RepID=A0AAX4IN08_9PEZI|nr:hypothetical protein CDEST_09844 [Colletotrichum destructivum]
MRYRSLGFSLAFLALTALAVGRGISVHLEPIQLPPTSPLNPPGRSDAVEDQILGPRLYSHPSGKTNPEQDRFFGTRSSRSPISLRSVSLAPLRPREEAPFELQQINCNDPKEPEYKRHPDVHRDAVNKGAKRFCESDFARDTLTIVDDTIDHPLHAWRWRYKDQMGVIQDYKVLWRAKCRTKQGFQDIGYPLGPGGPSCVDIMKDNYAKCNNGGIGGSTQAGCLVFTLNAGRKDNYY